MDEGVKRVLEISSEFSEFLLKTLLEDAEKNNAPRTWVNKVKTAFNEFEAVQADLIKKQGDCTIAQIRERIPNNYWFKVIKSMVEILKEEG